jgi:hypothetical protein
MADNKRKVPTVKKQATSKKTQKKVKPWFRQIRGSYIPNSRNGWLTYIPYGLYLIITGVVSFLGTTTVLSIVVRIAVLWIIGSCIMTVFASRRS